MPPREPRAHRNGLAMRLATSSMAHGHWLALRCFSVLVGPSGRARDWCCLPQAGAFVARPGIREEIGAQAVVLTHFDLCLACRGELPVLLHQVCHSNHVATSPAGLAKLEGWLRRRQERVEMRLHHAEYWPGAS